MKILQSRLRRIIREELFEALDPDDMAALRAAAQSGEKELKSAYRDLARKYHPDQSEYPEAEATRDFQDINQLHDELKDDPYSAWYPEERDEPGTEISVHVSEPSATEDANCDLPFGYPGRGNFGEDTGKPCPPGEEAAAEEPPPPPYQPPPPRPRPDPTPTPDATEEMHARHDREWEQSRVRREKEQKAFWAAEAEKQRLSSLERAFIDKIRHREPRSRDKIRNQYEKMITGEIGLPDVGGYYPGETPLTADWPEKDISTDEVYATIKDFKRAFKRQKKKIEYAMAKFDYERRQAWLDWKAEQEDNKARYVAETYKRWGELIK